MPFPFQTNNQWSDTDPHFHFATAKREHLDHDDKSRVLNGLAVKGIPETESPSLERIGMTWTIKIPCKVNTNPGSSGITVDGVVFTPQQVSICVANQTKTMLILGSEPY